MYEQVLDPAGDSLLTSAALALVVLFVVLGRVKLEAREAGLDATLLAAATSSGGVLGWSLALLLIMCVIVLLQATPVLSWTVV